MITKRGPADPALDKILGVRGGGWLPGDRGCRGLLPPTAGRRGAGTGPGESDGADRET